MDQKTSGTGIHGLRWSNTIVQVKAAAGNLVRSVQEENCIITKTKKKNSLLSMFV